MTSINDKGDKRVILRFMSRFGSSFYFQPRKYQKEVSERVVESVEHHLGLSIVVVFPRQSGKNELQAQLEASLLRMYFREAVDIVKIAPTWRPQAQNSLHRLERILRDSKAVRAIGWRRENGYIVGVGRARVIFLSGAPEANIVGATVSLLLEVDEAQDVLAAKYDKDVAPMAASTNATRVFWGTAWTSKTLLARELRAARELERKDGRRRVWVLTADDVASEVPEYGAFVREQVAKLGRSHPMVKTQFFSEEIDAEGGMFPAGRIALMRGEQAAAAQPAAGRVYAALLDVAGEDEGAVDGSEGGELVNPRRDSTVLTIVEVDLSGLADPGLSKPRYLVAERKVWIGVKHSSLYGQIRALAELWGVRFLVADATGVGAGLVSFLDRALPGKVLAFEFNSSTKSQLGWDFLAVVDTGRWKEAVNSPYLAVLQTQLENCQYTIVPGPAKLMRWGVPDGTRDPRSGELVHDDLILSAALSAVLDGQEWSATGPALVVPGRDALGDLDRGGF